MTGELVATGAETRRQIVYKWITLMAEKIGRPLEPVLVDEFAGQLERADITDRGVELALRVLLGSIRFWTDFSIPALIDSAIQQESQARRDERPKLPRMDYDNQVKAEADETFDRRLAEAKALAEKYPAECRDITKQMAVTFCRQCNVATVKKLTPLMYESYRAAVVGAILAAPGEWARHKSVPIPAPLSDETLAQLREALGA